MTDYDKRLIPPDDPPERPAKHLIKVTVTSSHFFVVDGLEGEARREAMQLAREEAKGEVIDIESQIIGGIE